jgi:hypothetical protein
MYLRFISSRVEEALTDTPVVLVNGPRRAGKTTLVQQIKDRDRSYLTLDDPTTLAAAKADPVGFIRGLNAATIDEIQRVPDLLLAIKQSVDNDRRPGRFLLTGSANILTIPRVADSLAGRMEIVRMLPLARSEIVGRRPTFLDEVFSGRVPAPRDLLLGDDLMRAVLAGGYPEALTRRSERRRQDWADAYVEAVVTRDLKDIAVVERLTDLPKFMRLLAEHSGQMANYSELGCGIGVDYKTSQRYVRLLEQLFLITTLAPWYTNAIKRIVKSPKLHVMDSGILAAVRGVTFSRLKTDRGLLGSLLETFVVSEVMKLCTWSNERCRLHHFRDHAQHEVDLLLEDRQGRIVGIEVKARATVNQSDFSGLHKVAEVCKDRLVFGVVLYDSDRTVPFGDRLFAAPISSLWS